MYNVSGLVTYEGKPIPRGHVQFRPDTSQGNSGPAGSATIIDGKYSTAQGGRGIVGGPHTVLISGYDGNSAKEPEMMPMGSPLFRGYEATIDLPKETVEGIDFAVKKSSIPKAPTQKNSRWPD